MTTKTENDTASDEQPEPEPCYGTLDDPAPIGPTDPDDFMRHYRTQHGLPPDGAAYPRLLNQHRIAHVLGNADHDHDVPGSETEPTIEVGDIVRHNDSRYGRVTEVRSHDTVVTTLKGSYTAAWPTDHLIRVDDPCAGWTTDAWEYRESGTWCWNVRDDHDMRTALGMANTEADAKARATEALDRARLDLLTATEGTS